MVSHVQMKNHHSSLGAIILYTGILIGCASHKTKPSSDDPLTLAFKHAASVRLLSYSDRMYEPPVIEGEEQKDSVETETVFRVVGDLRIAESTIKEEITLDGAQRDSLLRLLQLNLCETDGVAICYNPRHAILFYDSNDRPFSYIEICFECTNYQTYGDFALDFCYEKSQAIRSLFQSVGIEYFEVGER